MLFKTVFSTLFYCALSATSFPNLFYVRNCVVLIGRENITFQNSFIQTKYEGDDVFFSACKDLAQVGCDNKAIVCLKKKEKFINFIEKNEERSDFFTLKSKEGYQFNIQLNSRNYKYNIFKSTKNNYTLEINPDFKEHCTKTILNDRNLFFNDLFNNDIFIETKDVKVAINLCGTSPFGCSNDDSSICSLNKTTNETVEWGKISRLSIDNNEDLVFDYKTKKKGGLHSSITLKCNWTTSEGPKSFKRINNNNKLDVVIESSLACSKKKLDCLLTDDNYLYDISNLSRFDGWKLNGYNKSDVKLNICGPLKSQKTCFDQQSQVCLFNNNELNYGSISTPVKIENDVIKFSMKDGSQCPKNSTLNLKTIFELHCSFKEEGPRLIKENDCSFEIQWKTPSACPKKNPSVGNHEQKSYQINRSCSIQDGDKTYNLSPLSRNAENYLATKGEIDFFINVCRPIVSMNDIFCNNYMGICLRNNSEPNIKKSFFNLGSLKSPEVKNGQLLLRYTNGNFDMKCYKDASAIIYFNCFETKNENGPIFIKEERCLYEFQWNTSYACPNKVNCIKRNNLDKLINFENVKANPIQIKAGANIYTIDICKDQITTNDLNDNNNKRVEEFKSNTKIQTDESGTFLEYKLEKSCRDKTDFNEIKIQLDCDSFLNNDHYEDDNISNCSLHLKLKHNDFCAFSPTSTPKTIVNKEKEIVLTPKILDDDFKDSKNYHYDVDNKINVKIVDCIFQFKDEEIHLNDLRPLTIKSPNKQFNYINYTIGSNSTSLCYPHFICKENKPLVTLTKCPKVRTEKNGLKLTFNSTVGINQSEIFFYCKNEEKFLPEVASETKDFISFRYPLKELCFFETQSNGTSSLLIAGIVSCIFIIFLAGVLIYYKRFLVKLCSKDKSNTYIYCRNSEL